MRGEIYYGLIKAFAAAGNLSAAVEAVFDMHHQGILFSINSRYHEEALNDIRGFIVNLLLRDEKHLEENKKYEVKQDKIQLLEKVYFALTEQAREGVSIPPLLLEAWIESTCYCGYFDRSLRMIHQIDHLFQIPPTVNFYNALLQGISVNDSQHLENIQIILDELDKLQVLHPEVPEYRANQDSYSIVFDSMLAHGKFSSLSKLWQVCKSKNIYPKHSSLRKVAHALSSENMEKEAEEMLQIIKIGSNGAKNEI